MYANPGQGGGGGELLFIAINGIVEGF